MQKQNESNFNFPTGYMRLLTSSSINQQSHAFTNLLQIKTVLLQHRFEKWKGPDAKHGKRLDESKRSV